MVSARFAEPEQRDRCTVHVHLSVSDPVEPCPSQRCLALRHLIRNLELELVRSVAVRVRGEVTGGVGGAATLDGEDDLPNRGLRGRTVVGD